MNKVTNLDFQPPDVREGHQQVYDCWSASFPGPDLFDNEHMMEGGYGFAQFMFSNNMTNLAQAYVPFGGSHSKTRILPRSQSMFNITFIKAQKHWSYHG